MENVKNKKSRLAFPDMAKAAGIALVVVSHDLYAPEKLRSYACTVSVAVFFVIAGMLVFLSGKKDRPFTAILKDRALRLIVPYICFSVIDILMLMYMNKKTGAELISGIDTAVIRTVSLNGVSVLWFLSAIFFSEFLWLLLLKCGDRCFKNETAGAVFSFAAAGFLWGLAEVLYGFFTAEEKSMTALMVMQTIFRIFPAAVLMGYGHIFYLLYERTGLKDALAGKKRSIADMLTALILLGVSFVASSKNVTADLRTFFFGNIFLYVVTALAGSFGLLLFFKAFESLKEKLIFKIISFYGRESLIIMLTHTDLLVLYYAEVISFILMNRISFIGPLLQTFIIIGGVFVLELPLIFVIERFFPFLAGGGSRHGRKA